MSSNTDTKAVMPRQTMKGHTERVTGVVYLPERRRIMTCSVDGSLRLWDLESGAQIGKDWRDKEDKKAAVYGNSMALSPNGKTVVIGSNNRKVRLWDVETRKVVARWTGQNASTMCWSGDGNRVLSGSWDGIARVWDPKLVKSGETILEIKTGHEDVYAVIYSPDNAQIATGRSDKSTGGHYTHGRVAILEGLRGRVQIWNARTGELLATLEHDYIVCSLAWTSDGKRLISSSHGPIRIFDSHLGADCHSRGS